LNNEALSFVLQNDMERARQLLEELREKNPQFFPGRYNLGRVYLFFKDHQKALVEFEQAQRIVPQYWRNYYYIGKSFELQGDTNSAAYMYLTSYRHNIYDLESLVAMGDLLIEARRLREAETIFKYCLRQDDGFNDALIGLGKISYYYRKYYDATLWFKTVDRLKPFKKELHFFYGESAFYARDYETALPEYENMLQFPQDAIYNKISLTRMRQRLKQTKRLLQQTSEIE
jgi:tetratricopeptide (TPR) repeat protein